MNRRRRSPLLVLLGAAALALSGCAPSSGPGQYTLSGAVLYQGKPVPVGEITLSPDGARGNTGPGAIASIKDGKYQTLPGKGIVGGAYVVQIVGFDGVPVDAMSSAGTALFPPYETRVEFPCESTTHDFAILPSANARQ
ncbi:MAG: hypothetical protein ABFD16_19975 [Thermoguttaceae bacterium]